MQTWITSTTEDFISVTILHSYEKMHNTFELIKKLAFFTLVLISDPSSAKNTNPPSVNNPSSVLFTGKNLLTFSQECHPTVLG